VGYFEILSGLGGASASQFSKNRARIFLLLRVWLRSEPVKQPVKDGDFQEVRNNVPNCVTGYVRESQTASTELPFLAFGTAAIPSLTKYLPFVLE
jgi:hypothetical protein